MRRSALIALVLAAGCRDPRAVDLDRPLVSVIQVGDDDDGEVRRTISERDAGTGFGPWASGDEEVYLLAFDITDVSVNADCELYRNFSIVKENFLPSWTTAWTSGMKAALRAAYRCTSGAA